jgi:hypothetical protein
VYQRVREREPALAAYPTGCALYDALSPKSGLAADARPPLLRVIVLEYQRGRHPLWHALAVRGLEPMLASLRARMRRLDADECDQQLQLAFVEAIGRLRLDRPGGPTFPLLTLRRAIARALIAAESEERERDEDVAFEEGAAACMPAPHQDPQQFVQCLAHEVGELLVRGSGGEDVLRVLTGDETLGEQVERLSAEDVTYDCLQKRHRRVVTQVRRELSRRSP